MSISFRKLNAISKLKFKMVLSNASAMMGPIMAIGMVVLMKFLYGSLAKGNPEQLNTMLGMALNMGILANISLGGIMLTCLPMAEEKEKNTLRSLMTSSVNGVEYFLGSLVAPMIMMVVTNVLVVILSGIDLSHFSWGIYLLITTIASLISCILGMLIALFSKNQMSASTYMTPFSLVLMMLPMFSSFNEKFASISEYLYTGIVAKMVTTYGNGMSFSIGLQQMVVIGLEMVLIVGLFIYFYKRNGYETD